MTSLDDGRTPATSPRRAHRDRRANQNPSTWDKIYGGEGPAWEIGHPQPVLVELAEKGLLSGRMLDVGCGTGEHTILAAEHGANALGVDLSPKAIELASRKAQERGVDARFAVADALWLEALGRNFDVALDSGLFHVFNEEQRPLYAASVGRVLHREGTLWITCMSDRQSGDWGPHRVTEEEIRGTFRDGWSIEELTLCDREIHRPEVGVWNAKAWLARIRHTAAPSTFTRVRSDVKRDQLRPSKPSTLADQLRTHAQKIERAERSSVLAGIVASAADDFEGGGVVAAAFEGIDAGGSSAPAARLLASLHFLVLADHAPELARLLTDPGDAGARADAWPTAKVALTEHLEEVRSFLAAPIKTSEPGRTPALFGALLLLATRYRLPITLLEVGAGAGLNLQVDRFGYRIGGTLLGAADSPVIFENPWKGLPVADIDAAACGLSIVERAGCDPDPVDLSTEIGKLRLLSYVRPDEPVRLERLRQAIAVAASSPAPIARAAAPQWLARKLASRTPGRLTVIWQPPSSSPRQNSLERARVEGVLIAASTEATPDRPIAAVELEPLEQPTAHLRLTLRLWPRPAREVLARCRPHGSPVRWLIERDPPTNIER